MKPYYLPRSPLSTGRRLGFHYFPDTLHYRQADLTQWVPRLQSLGASWLVLEAETGRAIPEFFLNGLIEAGIEPLIHFRRGMESSLDLREIRPLLEAYARWGARYVIYFDRPNARSTWPARGWVQQDLIKNFLDRFLPAAALTMQLGLVPVFPPLEPGGSYWDTVFLRSALQTILERNQEPVLRGMALAAYGWTGGRSLDWGAGGPEYWPQSRPYQTPPGSQDQCGFRIFDWYQAVVQTVLQRTLPIFLLQAGSPYAQKSGNASHEEAYSRSCSAIVRLLEGETVIPEEEQQAPQEPLQPIPPQVAACCFWLLSADLKSPFHQEAWFQKDLSAPEMPEEAEAYCERPAVSVLRKLQAAKRMLGTERSWTGLQAGESIAKSGLDAGGQTAMAERAALHPLKHFLLLPGHEWGISDWYLEVARPFIKKYRPTIGFSMEEAVLAARVTVVGNVPGFTREVMDHLTQSGCEVEWIDGDGTTIATQLAER